MRGSNKVARRRRISVQFEETWKGLRRLRRGIHRRFGKAEKYTFDVLPSPFRSYNTIPFESDPSGPPLSSTSLQTIEKLGREASGHFTKILSPAMDGALEKRFGISRSAPVTAIFVHAGAGYHSTTNEHIHLGACKE